MRRLLAGLLLVALGAGPAAAIELFSDTFVRGDSTDLGASWSVPTGWVRFGIVSNSARPSDLTGSDDAEYVNAVTPPDAQYAQVEVTVTITTADSNFNGCGPAIRMATGAQTLYGALTVDSRVKLMEMNAGVSAAILGTFLTTWVDGDTVYIEGQSDNLAVKVNGTTQITATDATITGGRFGIVHGTSSGASLCALSDFAGGDFTAAGGANIACRSIGGCIIPGQAIGGQTIR